MQRWPSPAVASTLRWGGARARSAARGPRRSGGRCESCCPFWSEVAGGGGGGCGLGRRKPGTTGPGGQRQAGDEQARQDEEPREEAERRQGGDRLIAADVV